MLSSNNPRNDLGNLAFRLDIAPQPASRVRVTKSGCYHLKPYAAWLREVRTMIPKAIELFNGPIFVSVDFACKRPKRLTLGAIPVGDIDNYVKAVYDAITHSGNVWADDKQITMCEAFKRYAEVDEDPHLFVEIVALDSYFFYPSRWQLRK